MPSACCREGEAVTLRQLADRGHGLLRQIASVATVVELLIDLDSVVAPANQGPTSEWDKISKVTFEFIFGLCTTFGFSLSVQSKEVGDRMWALYSGRGLQQLGGSGLEAFGPVDFPLDRYVLSIDGTVVSVDVVPHPTAWWTMLAIICFRRYQVGTSPQWLARHRASGLAGPRRGFLQAWLLRKLVPDDLQGMFDDALDDDERKFYGGLVTAFASEQPDLFLLLLEELRAGPAALQQLLLGEFSASASEAIRSALVELRVSGRRREAKLALEHQLTAEAVTQALEGKGPRVLLGLPGCNLPPWDLAHVLGKLRKSHRLGWLPANPAKESMPKLVEEVLRFLFSSEGGTIGGASACSRSPARI
jgi:hypothetical protein